MDIINLIFLILHNIVIFDYSSLLKVASDTLVLEVVFGILAFFWTYIVIIITLSTTFFVILWVPRVYRSTCKLGIYHRLIERRGNCENASQSGEYDIQKIWEVLKANFVVGLTLFVVLIYILNTVPSAFFINENCCALNATINQSQSTSPHIPLNRPISDIAFSTTLILIPTFLLTLRLLANPTHDWINFIINCRNHSTEEIENKIRNFKDQVTSFYYSFIMGTMILVYLAILFTAGYNNSVDYRLISPFMPKMDIYSIFFFLFLEIVIILTTTLIGEWYLKIRPPIVQI